MAWNRCNDATVANLYQDQRVTCTDDAVVIRWYYLWGGDKRIPYTSIRSARRVELSALRGKPRIWGTANLRYWANLDPGRPGKLMALILDVGKAVRPYITPDDVPAVEEVLRERAGLGEIPFDGASPVI